MKIFFKFWILFVLSPTLLVVETVEAKEINIVVAMSVPPYFIQATNEGYEIDIIKGVLHKVGHIPVFKYVPLQRVPWVYEHDQNNTIDAIATTDERVNVKAYFSDVYITYQNVGISLAKNKLKLNTPADLVNLSIVAFQNSRTYLGDEYKKATQNNRNYLEVFEQDKQVKMLYYGTSQVVIADKNIFDYYAARIGNLDAKETLVYHDIFPKNHYKMAFKVKSLRDDFNRGFIELKKSGEYDKILNKWTQNKVSIPR